MASRYLITGVQIGMLMVFSKVHAQDELLKEIEDKQFVGTSKNSIEDDVATIAMEWNRGLVE
jgi:hypothetical protein